MVAEEGMQVGDSSHDMTISNSDIQGSTFTNGHNYSSVDHGGADLAKLRELLREHRAELIRLGGTRGERVQSRLDEIEEELEDHQPDKPAVQSAWKSLLKALQGGATAAKSVSTINDVIRSLFGA
jgi:hypothetical protein